MTTTEKLKSKPDDAVLGFGTLFTDYMFNMDYAPDKGWHSPRIEPYASIEMDPATMFCTTARAFLRDSRPIGPNPAVSSCSGPRKT